MYSKNAGPGKNTPEDDFPSLKAKGMSFAGPMLFDVVHNGRNMCQVKLCIN